MRLWPTRISWGMIPALVFFTPEGAHAAWVGWFQWGTQGSYVHQFAHILFLGAMLFFIREMRREGLRAIKGYRYLIWACWFLAFWNFDAIVGHTLEWSLEPIIVGSGLARRMVMENVYLWLLYITKFNHFALLIPALFLFYRGLKALAAEVQTRE